LAGIELADSVALDPHKWLHTPFEAGCVLVRDAQRHFETFEMHGEYLQLQTQRHHRGKVPRRLRAGTQPRLQGAEDLDVAEGERCGDKLGRLVDQNIAQARHLEALIAAEPRLDLVAPVDLNIVCFRYVDGLKDEAALKAVNTEIMLRIQESGVAILSDTTVSGRHCLRVAINNHRTTRQDLSLLLSEVLRTGERVAHELARSAAPVSTAGE
jgi:aromatic-L-amino-acid/L-tryptophan decarboxylase